MKKIFSALLLAIATTTLLQSSAQEPQTAVQLPKGNRLTITVPNDMVDRDKWVFMFASGYDDQILIVDSIYLKKGQTTFSFQDIKITNNAEVNHVYLDQAANYIELYKFDAKFDLHYCVDSIGRESITGSGGRANYQQLESSTKRRLMYLHKQDTLAKLRNDKVSFEHLCKVEDSLDKVRNDYFEQCVLRDLNSQYGEVTFIAYLILRDHFRYDQDRLDEIMKKLKKRFPKERSLGKFQPLPPTKETLYAREKQLELLGMKLPDGQSQNERPKVEPYKMGDVVSGLAIKDKDGKLISLDSIKTKFVLVDFWAHWCAPCRKESPYLIQAQNEFSDKFTVYAVSVDKNAQKWLNAIRDDHTEMLTHVLLGEGTAEANLVLAKFDVKSLPKNFLLDDQRKIIAIDLRGDELLDVIREFCKE